MSEAGKREAGGEKERRIENRIRDVLFWKSFFFNIYLCWFQVHVLEKNLNLSTCVNICMHKCNKNTNSESMTKHSSDMIWMRERGKSQWKCPHKCVSSLLWLPLVAVIPPGGGGCTRLTMLTNLWLFTNQLLWGIWTSHKSYNCST